MSVATAVSSMSTDLPKTTAGSIGQYHAGKIVELREVSEWLD